MRQKDPDFYTHNLPQGGDSMIGRLGTTELLVIFGIILVVFGPSRLPELGSSLGKGIREFRQAAKGLKDSIEVEAQDPESDK